MEKAKRSTGKPWIGAICKKEADDLKKIFEARKKELGLTQEMVGDELGISQGAIGHYLNGRNPLNLSAALGFSRLLGVDVEAFSPRLAGELRLSTLAISPENGRIDVLNAPNHTRISVRDAAQILNDEPGSKTVLVFGNFGESTYGHYLESKQMEGLSGEYIKAGSLLVVDAATKPRLGDVAIASVNGDIVVGEYGRHAGVSVLVPSNDRYRPVEVSESDIKGVIKRWITDPN